ncbi:thioredoxin family protein [Cyanobacterium aponinum UTEX 3222]|uniref:Thioredoxin domain-containing protein n=1 Tax=Cyanobacterium aponinum (strain PCC 10605) TaxID=755178 RepID=K9Z825_CYAAP|nr:thioredoxin family protein [Cyanobacterium aponinum]AFZ55346.1 Thioredoxin domain-containing protein [Cyanobacterium aponinum PCC 10605]PHV62868.1 thiol:disulfide interchange protein [Cyanobacterium aponinum IPPAS B-1201]WRL39790.1 thioredoxin family protein [Cyanobacterium aponinum UTEX 3221]WRL42635.1 thioredoxin family protein [Cyanobacterium aponinum UTEX 3222]
MTDSPNTVNKIRNLVIALVAIALAITLVFASQTKVSSQSLEAQAQKATNLDIALNNGKPSLVEFYANWCTSCQAMAGDLAQLKENFEDKINFVMLNVDNSKWLPEILNYGVDGIPHFVFFNENGDAIADTIGEQPLTIFEENLQALLNHQPLPYANSRGNISAFNPANKLQTGNQDNPRDHR